MAATAHVIEYDGDPKPVGVLGAPALRCTPLFTAMVVALLGLVFVGIGGCMAGFMSHEPLPKYCGIVLVIAGIIMILGGIGYWIYESLTDKSSANRHRAPPQRASPQQPQRPANAVSAGYVPAPQAVPQQTRPYAPAPPQQVQQAPPPASRPINVPTARGPVPVQNEPRKNFASAQTQQAPIRPQPQIREEPPPAYNVVAADDSRSRQPVSSTGYPRTSQSSAVREQRLMSSTAV